MSVTLGSYTTLPNPSQARQRIEAPGQVRTMADGSLVSHRKCARYTWDYTWEVATASLANLVAAIEAAILATKTFKPWDTASTYSVVVDPDSYSVEPMEDSDGNAWRVSATMREVTA